MSWTEITTYEDCRPSEDGELTMSPLGERLPLQIFLGVPLLQLLKSTQTEAPDARWDQTLVGEIVMVGTESQILQAGRATQPVVGFRWLEVTNPQPNGGGKWVEQQRTARIGPRSRAE